jgi:hypothetical protein
MLAFDMNGVKYIPVPDNVLHDSVTTKLIVVNTRTQNQLSENANII